jgi:phage terminase large subunit
MAGAVWEPGAKIERGRTRVFIFDWRQHPGKTQQWYDELRHRWTAEGMAHIFAQEVDRDYAGSVMGVIIKREWIVATIDAHLKLADWGDWFEGDATVGEDVADGGRDRNAYLGRKGSVVVRTKVWAGEAGRSCAGSCTAGAGR